MSEKACSTCRFITTGNICPRCRTPTLSDDFSGLIIIFDTEGSAIAKVMNIKKKGRYALKVR
ncbi:MAG: transcription elongation factor subunit Spt4 [Candidatus Bathyarchaeia archaeon]|nr:transcription elongation factor subunit Spt4 [Candidatus Bathyarchaeia archaeon]MDI6904039.1 transcription elongation factor subunit Spt4 [Candidatus Bathyarchaeia archaeon]